MTQNLRPFESDEDKLLLPQHTKPPDSQDQIEGASRANLQAQVEELTATVLHLKDMLHSQNQELERLRQLATRKPAPTNRTRSQPPTKRTKRGERKYSMESGEILSDAATSTSADMMSEDEQPRHEDQETKQTSTGPNDNQLVTVGMLRQILQEALQPQRKEPKPKIATAKDLPKSYAKVAASLPADRPRAAFSKARAENLAARAIAPPTEPIEFTRMHFRPHRSLKGCRSGAETRAVITSMLEKLGIYNRKPYKKSKVFEWSKIVG